MTASDETRAADWIAQRRQHRRGIADMPPEIKPASEEAGYRVQAAVLGRLCAAGWGATVGWKVGVTTPQMRALLGIDAPIGGAMLAAGRHEPGARLRHADYVRIGIECEIAMMLQSPLGGPGKTIDASAAAAAVAALHPAIEIVDDRYGGAYRIFGVPAIIADNSFHAGFVLGPAVEDWRAIDLAVVRGVTRANGTTRGEGRGADVQGHPMASLAWMATKLGALGGRLEPGQIVLTGSLPVPYWAEPADDVEIEIEGLGVVRLAVV